LRLHDYPASGNCYKVRLLLALLDRPYERVPTDIFAGETLTEEFGRLNPVRETPVLELESGEVIVQSNAILWYLAEGTEFLPADAVGGAQTVEWLHFEQERIVYTHVAPDAGIELNTWPAVQSWIDRIEGLPGFVDDYVRYPDNARPGRGRSIYDKG